MKFKRIEKRYEIDPVTGCWNWLLYKNKGGYGKEFRYGKAQAAHRMAFLDANGWLPKELDHICRNRACVNPEHLRPVTRSQNLQNSAKAKLTAEQVIEIRKSYTGRRGERISLMRRFGIGSTQFRRIIKNVQWKEILVA